MRGFDVLAEAVGNGNADGCHCFVVMCTAMCAKGSKQEERREALFLLFLSLRRCWAVSFVLFLEQLVKHC